METECALVDDVGALYEVRGTDADALRRVLATATGQPDGTPHFPGPNPVSIDRSHFASFRTQAYHVAEKTDGVRFAFLVCMHNGLKACIIFDRKLTPYIFKVKKCPRALAQGTVFDGELVRNAAGDLEFLIFDAMVACGIPIYNSSFTERLRVARTSLSFYEWSPGDTAKISVKQFVPAADAKMRMPSHIEKLRANYKIDGLVFMPDRDPVVRGRHDRLFKLKTDHTLDFLVHKKKLHVFDEKTRKNKVVGAPTPATAHLAVDGSIVECRLDPACSTAKHDAWIVLRRRADKATSNTKFTFDKTLLNIREALTLDAIPL